MNRFRNVRTPEMQELVIKSCESRMRYESEQTKENWGLYKEAERQRRRLYYKENTQLEKDWQKQYRDMKKEHNELTIKCECGSNYGKCPSQKLRHFKTKKHLQWSESQNL